jgi:hypothetical protein
LAALAVSGVRPLAEVTHPYNKKGVGWDSKG